MVHNTLELIERTKQKLGYPIIQIEITDSQIAASLQESINTFNMLTSLSCMDDSMKSKIEKGWITKYLFALSKETLGLIRGRFNEVLPDLSVNANIDYKHLISDGREDQLLLTYLISKDENILRKIKNDKIILSLYLNSNKYLNHEDTIYVIKKLEKLTDAKIITFKTEKESRVECVYPNIVSEKVECEIDKLEQELKLDTDDEK